jgi:hypothetical protein
MDMFKRRALRAPARPLFELAARQWTIAPSEPAVTARAYYLPDQIDRIIKSAFMEGHPRRLVEGGVPIVHKATRGFVFKDVHLIDGVLYKNDGTWHLRPRASRLPQLRVQTEIDHAAIYCTIPGNRYFGHWLLDDCVLYPLASKEGLPVTTAQPPAKQVPHADAYERRFEMKPLRVESAFFRELVMFDDLGQNSHKRERFGRLREKLLASLDAEPHPGVFIIRGDSGQRRILKNELEVAEHLRVRRGFRVVDVTKADVDTLLQTCVGARTVVGTEGSHLIHGLLVMPAGGSVLTIQPPKRFSLVYKDLADRERLNFGFVLGAPDGDDFVADLTEVERTLDLLP